MTPTGAVEKKLNGRTSAAEAQIQNRTYFQNKLFFNV